MAHRIKIFAVIFICSALFVFGFYYLGSHNALNSVLLGIIGGSVLGGLGSLLLPFVRNHQNKSSQKDPED
tara:strand:- start:1651 stop:1860 length:210 start_codon:yes stop_codon:yes gene_type:complete